MMTKSLHTVTAVAKVARHIAVAVAKHAGFTDEQYCAMALTVLGYEHSPMSLAAAIKSGDTTLAACLAGVQKELRK